MVGVPAECCTLARKNGTGKGAGSGGPESSGWMRHVMSDVHDFSDDEVAAVRLILREVQLGHGLEAVGGLIR